MKLYVVLISLVTSMAFFMGYVTLNIKNNLSKVSVKSSDIVNMQKKFDKQVAPLAILDFKALYYLPGQIKLINPLFTLTSYKSLKLRGDDSFPTCKRVVFSQNIQFNNEKESIWNQFICGSIKTLPYDFFIKQPYVHSYGFSYPYLAYKMGLSIFTKESWVRDNIPLFHVTELSEISKKIGRLDGYYAVLADFSRESLIDLLKSESSILSSDKYLVRTLKRTNTYGLVYKVYHRSHLEGFLGGTRFNVKKWRFGESCAYREGKVCWSFTPNAMNAFISQSSSYLFYALLAVLFLILWMILNKIRSDKAQDENRKMALRVLTHEFRTPVTSLLLQMENLSRQHEVLPEIINEQHLKVKDNVYRLKRLTEMSQKYLSAESKTKTLDFKFQKIDSVNNFFEDLIQNFAVKIIYNPLQKDVAFCLDPYWLNICIRNLIENAIKHGELPIKLTLKKISNHLEICVEDAGHSNDLNFNRITGAFIKGNKSEGMGLGLNIVQKTIKDMGGKFSLQKNPTQFYIKIKEGKI